MTDPVVDFVTDALYRRYPELDARFGERGRRACREDLERHMDYLAASLDVDEPGPFVDYVVWLRQVLVARGVGTVSLQDSLSMFKYIFRRRASASLQHRLDPILDAASDVLEAGDEATGFQIRHAPEPLISLDSLVGHLVRGQHRDAAEILKEVASDHRSYVDMAVHVIQPAMYEVGRRWQDHEISVADEHLATATSRYLLSEAFLEETLADPVGSSITVACVEGNHHSLGAQMVADAFTLAGWDVAFLGADTPTSALVAHVVEHRPDVLGLSVSLPQHLERARSVIEHVRSDLGDAAPAIIIGGLAANQLEDIWRKLGADAWGADAKLALTSAR